MYPPNYNTGDDVMAPDNRGKCMGDIGDWINSGWDDYGEDSYYPYTPRTLKCKYCNSTKVYWHKHKNGSFCLFDSSTNKAHECESKKQNKLDDELVEVVKITKARVPRNNCKKCRYYFKNKDRYSDNYLDECCMLFGEFENEVKRLGACIKGE